MSDTVPKKRKFNLKDAMDDVNAYIDTPKETTSPVQPNTAEETKPKQEVPTVSYKEPDKQFRRNITLSEELFRRLEFIKKSKNKARGKEDELVTLDKLMFDMIQHCLDTQYPETKAMFEKYIKLKEMEDFADLM